MMAVFLVLASVILFGLPYSTSGQVCKFQNNFGPVCPFDCASCGAGSCNATGCTGYCKNNSLSTCAFGDISRGKVTAESSNYGSNHPASKAVDGTYATDNVTFCTHTEVVSAGGSEQPWWRIDFGTEHVIYGISLYNRILNTGISDPMDRLSFFEVRVGNTDIKQTIGKSGDLFSNNTRCKYFNGKVKEQLNGNSKPYVELMCEEPLRGRYLSVQNINKYDDQAVSRSTKYENILTICEVDIRGYEVCRDNETALPSCNITGCWCWDDVCDDGNILGYCTEGCKTGRLGRYCTEEPRVDVPMLSNITKTTVNVTLTSLYEDYYEDSRRNVSLQYVLQYCADGDSQWTTTESEVISNLHPEKTYHFRAKLTKKTFEKVTRDVVSSGNATKCRVPTAVTDLKVVNSSCGGNSSTHPAMVELEWEDSTKCNWSVVYDVEYKINDSLAWTMMTVSSKRAKITEMLRNTTYVFRVKVRYDTRLPESYTSIYSHEAETTTVSGVKPTNVMLESHRGPTNDYPSNITMAVRWAQPTCPGIQISKYILRYRKDGESATTESEVNADVRNKGITNLEPITNYEVQIEAETKSHGKESTTWKNKTTVEGKSGPVEIQKPEVTPTAVKLSWHSPEKAYGIIKGYYVILQSTTPVNDCVSALNITHEWKIIKEYIAKTARDFTNLSPCHKYTVVVVPVNAAGQGVNASRTFTTAALEPMNKFDDLKIQRISDEEVTVTWSKSPPGYETATVTVNYRATADDPVMTVNGTFGSGLIRFKVEPGVTYTYNVSLWFYGTEITREENLKEHVQDDDKTPIIVAVVIVLLVIAIIAVAVGLGIWYVRSRRQFTTDIEDVRLSDVEKNGQDGHDNPAVDEQLDGEATNVKDSDGEDKSAVDEKSNEEASNVDEGDGLAVDHQRNGESSDVKDGDGDANPAVGEKSNGEASTAEETGGESAERNDDATEESADDKISTKHTDDAEPDPAEDRSAEADATEEATKTDDVARKEDEPLDSDGKRSSHGDEDADDEVTKMNDTPQSDSD